MTSQTNNSDSFSHLFNEKQIMITDYDSFSNVTILGVEDRQEAIETKKRLIENEKMRKKLDEEIEATVNLIYEGDPFLINRQQYLDILCNLRGKGVKPLGEQDG